MMSLFGSTRWIARMVLLLAGGTLAGGCMQLLPPPPPTTLHDAAIAVIADVLGHPVEVVTDSTLSPEARLGLEAGRFQLQCQALEIAAEFPEIVKPAWLEDGLNSRSDRVEYAALMAIGQLADHQGGSLSRPYQGRVRQMVDEHVPDAGGRPMPRNAYLRLAGGYALFKITGDPQEVAFLPKLLDPRTKPTHVTDEMFARFRSDVVYVLSKMPSLGPAELIRTALTDPSSEVQVRAYTRLAVLGDLKATDRTINMLQSPVPDEQLDALDALGQTRMDDLAPLKLCLRTSRMREVQMAAARALGLHGDTSALRLALAGLNYKDPARLSPEQVSKDPLHEDRVRILAALALGAIGDYDRSAGPLLEVIQTSSSRRFQLTASRAALELLRRSGRGTPAAGSAP
jgi:HEAT repeat protein